MSVISHVLITHCEGSTSPAIANLSAWCVENDPERQQVPTEIDMDYAGGRKFFVNHVLAMAANYFPAEKLAEAFPTFGWHLPLEAVLIVETEGESGHVVRGDGQKMDWMECGP